MQSFLVPLNANYNCDKMPVFSPYFLGKVIHNCEHTNQISAPTTTEIVCAHNWIFLCKNASGWAAKQIPFLAILKCTVFVSCLEGCYRQKTEICTLLKLVHQLFKNDFKRKCGNITKFVTASSSWEVCNSKHNNIFKYLFSICFNQYFPWRSSTMF